MHEVNTQEAELLDETINSQLKNHWCMGPLFKTSKPNAKRKRYGAQPE